MPLRRVHPQAEVQLETGLDTIHMLRIGHTTVTVMITYPGAHLVMMQVAL
jgi:hypothetical protein